MRLSVLLRKCRKFQLLSPFTSCRASLCMKTYSLAFDVVATGKRAQLVLHVQSISQWAPSCIGPYSQAVLTEGLVFFAGQIGLHPPTMDLLPSLALQARQCFSSCEVCTKSLLTDSKRSKTSQCTSVCKYTGKCLPKRKNLTYNWHSLER